MLSISSSLSPKFSRSLHRSSSGIERGQSDTNTPRVIEHAPTKLGRKAGLDQHKNCTPLCLVYSPLYSTRQAATTWLVLLKIQSSQRDVRAEYSINNDVTTGTAMALGQIIATSEIWHTKNGVYGDTNSKIVCRVMHTSI